MARHARRHPTPRAIRTTGLAVGLLLGAGLVVAAAVPLPTTAPVLTLRLAPTPTPRATVNLPFPTTGEAAVGLPTFDAVYASAHQAAVPIASLTKLMTAYVTLHDLPLTATEAGPVLEVTAAELNLYRVDQRTDQSSVRVAVGERLNERELLEGMLVHSANNFADMLGALVAGSDHAMVAQMNATARSLHLGETSYVDVSGIDPHSQSDAVDVLALATRLMSNATFAAIVRMRSVVLPVAGVVATYTPYLGQGGVIGVKTGFTSRAGGCDVMAYDDHVGRRHVLVVSVVLGQTSTTLTPLEAAGVGALHLAATLARHLHGLVVTVAHQRVGAVGWSSGHVPVLATSTIDVPSFSAVAVHVVVELAQWRANELVAGQRLGLLVVTSGATKAATWLVAGATLTRPSLWQRLR